MLRTKKGRREGGTAERVKNCSTAHGKAVVSAVRVPTVGRHAAWYQSDDIEARRVTLKEREERRTCC